MAGRHRCRPRSIQIIRTGIVAAADTKRPDIQQFHVSLSRVNLLFVVRPRFDTCLTLHIPLGAVRHVVAGNSFSSRSC